MRTPDNYDLWEAHDAEQERRREQCPVCSECDRHIQDEHCYEINGELICSECMEENHLRSVEDYIF